MFVTDEESEVVTPPIFGEDGKRFWPYVGRTEHTPWFHVIYVILKDNVLESTSIGLMDYPEQLVDLQKNSDFKIKQVDIVSPVYMNRGIRWNMNPLSEIWEGMEPDLHDQQRLLIYVLENGERFVDSAISTKECDVLNRKLLFKI